MRYALVPGKVHLRNPDHAEYKATKYASGFQMLATCKQICNEGSGIFYGENIFFLPPGDVKYTNVFMDEVLKVQHRNMLRHLGIRFSLGDFELADEGSVSLLNLSSSLMEPSITLQAGDGWAVSFGLRQAWTGKCRFLFRWINSLSLTVGANATLHIEELPDDPIYRHLYVMQSDLMDPGPSANASTRNDYHRDIVLGEISRSGQAARKLIQRRIDRFGWPATKIWLGEKVADER